jgi:hypothetical protein
MTRTPKTLDEAFAETLRAIRRHNNLGKPAPLVRGITEAQAERAFQYVQSLANEPDRLERALYNAILAHIATKHSRDAFAKENKALRAELERLRSLVAGWGRKGSTPHPLKGAVIRAMADAILADPPERGTRWPDEKKAAFSRSFNLDALNVRGFTYRQPSGPTWSSWWRQAEALAHAERLAAEAEALDRLSAEIDWGDAVIQFDPPGKPPRG